MARAGAIQIGDGAEYPTRIGRLGDLVISAASGEYFELAKQNRMFVASQQAGAVFGTALTATAVTLTLFNPTGSGVNLSVIQTSVALTTTPTATEAHVIVYAANVTPGQVAPTTVTALGVRSALLGQAPQNQGQAYSAATLPNTPVVVRVHPFSVNVISTAANVVGSSGAMDFVNGGVSLAPGFAVTLQGLGGANIAQGIMSIIWAEIPV